MRTSELFEDKADLYAASRTMYPQALFDYIVSLTNGFDDVWDCAAGNGQAAIGLSKIFTNVHASDISKEQISNSFLRDNISYSIQPSEQTSFFNNQFDVVNVAQALHWFDYDRFWDEVSRVLKPTGFFVAYSYVWPTISDSIDKVVEDKVKDVIAPYWASNNRLAWDGYKAIEFPFDNLAAPKIDLTNQWNLNQFIDYIHTWSGTRRCMDDIGSDFFDIARNDLLEAWGDPQLTRAVKHPLTIISGNAWA